MAKNKNKQTKNQHKGKTNQKKFYVHRLFDKKIFAGNFLKIHCMLLKDPDFLEYVTTVKLYTITNID